MEDNKKQAKTLMETVKQTFEKSGLEFVDKGSGYGLDLRTKPGFASILYFSLGQLAMMLQLPLSVKYSSVVEKHGISFIVKANDDWSISIDCEESEMHIMEKLTLHIVETSSITNKKIVEA